MGVPEAFRERKDAAFVIRFSVPGWPALECSRTLGELSATPPGPRTAMVLAQLAMKDGRRDQARRLYEEALVRHPDDAQLHNRYAWDLVTWPAEHRDPTRAVVAARRAVALTWRRDWDPLDTLAEALLQAGAPAEARLENDAAMTLCPAVGSLQEREVRLRAALEPGAR